MNPHEVQIQSWAVSVSVGIARQLSEVKGAQPPLERGEKTLSQTRFPRDEK